jgi:hypothetical protein
MTWKKNHPPVLWRGQLVSFIETRDTLIGRCLNATTAFDGNRQPFLFELGLLPVDLQGRRSVSVEIPERVQALGVSSHVYTTLLDALYPAYQAVNGSPRLTDEFEDFLRSHAEKDTLRDYLYHQVLVAVENFKATLTAEASGAVFTNLHAYYSHEEEWALAVHSEEDARLFRQKKEDCCEV